MKKLLFGLTCLLIASPAYADWQYAKWGATPGEVIAASGGKAHRTRAGEAGTFNDGSEQLLSGVHSAGSRNFSVKFLFRANRLSSVQLTLEGAPSSACYALETDLTGLYGEPLSKSNGSGGDILSRKWADKANNNQIAFLFATFASNGCFVTYSPIQSAETQGL